MEKTIDCVCCGSCVADLLVRPVPLDSPIGGGNLLRTEPVQIVTGGIACNAGIAMARLGMRVAVLTYVGHDDWGVLIRRRLEAEGIDCQRLLSHPTAPSSTTAVLIDPSGERSFAHCVGAPRLMDKALMSQHMDLFARSRLMLLGYYSLMPNLEGDLPEVMAAIRRTGCQTALDTAGSGGGLEPLAAILPHLDFYVPSHGEAAHQTGLSDPRDILKKYRDCGAPGVLGVKLGSKGALLSPAAGEFIEIPCIVAPGPVVDTTGAGDTFYAGLLTGMLRGMSPYEAGRFAAAVGACCVTGLGASAGIRGFEETRRLAGV